MVSSNGKKYMKPALVFGLIMGIISLFSDMTHEGARSIYGAYLSLLGASAVTITSLWLVAFSVFTQLTAIPFFYFTWRSQGFN